MPRWFWKPILHGMILRLQPAKSAQLYREIWTDAGSPLIVHTYNLTKKVRTLLPDWEVTMAMTYGQPTIASRITKLQKNVTTSLSSHFFLITVNPLLSPLSTKLQRLLQMQQLLSASVATMLILRFWLIGSTNCGQQVTMTNCLFPITVWTTPVAPTISP